MVLTTITIIFCMWNSMNVHSPKLFWQDILCFRIVAIRLPESCLVCMRRITSDRGSGYTPIVIRVPWVSQTVITSNGAPLRPPKTRLSCTPLRPCRPQITWTIVCTCTGSGFTCSIFKTRDNSIEGITTYRNTATMLDC